MSKFKAGDHVHYCPSHGKIENGIIKRLADSGNGAFVVYNCAGNWDRYEDYTAANTNFRDLKPGWIEQPQTKKDDRYETYEG